MADSSMCSSTTDTFKIDGPWVFYLYLGTWDEIDSYVITDFAI